MIQMHSKLSNPLVYITVLVLSILVVTACGGGDDSNGSTPAPTAASTSVPTTPAAPASPPPQGGASAGTQGPETEAPSEAVSSSGSESLFISASEQDEFTIELVAGDRLQVTFDVESNITGGQNVIVGKGKAIEGIQLVIRDPLGDSLLTIEETTASETVEVEAEVNGEHAIIFFNPFPLQAQTVEVTYIVNP